MKKLWNAKKAGKDWVRSCKREGYKNKDSANPNMMFGGGLLPPAVKMWWEMRKKN